MKLTSLFLISFLFAVAPAMADDALAPGVASELDFDASCTKALVNHVDKTQSCLGFRRTVLGNGSTIFMLRIEDHTVSFIGNKDPATAGNRQVTSLEQAFIDESKLLAAGTCTLTGEIKVSSTLSCDVTAVAQGHDFSFQISFTSKGLLPLKPDKG